MATNRLEASNADAAAETAAAPSAARNGAETGGFKSWLPLVANLILMPVLAYGMTAFVLLPKLRQSGGQPSGGQSESAGTPSEHASKEPAGKNKILVNLSGKILVNVAGTGGTRYLLVNLTLVSSSPDLKSVIEKNDAQLRDVAAGVLASKTINDLEKPGARNLIRSELTSVFNGVLGNGLLSEIYMTEFAIQ